MPLWFLPALIAFFAVISLAAGIWLLLHRGPGNSTFRANATRHRPAARPSCARGFPVADLGIGMIGVGAWGHLHRNVPPPAQPPLCVADVSFSYIICSIYVLSRFDHQRIRE